MSLKNVSRGVYAAGTQMETDGMFPVWLDADKTARHIGVTITLSDTFGSAGTKVSDLYPESIRTGTLIHEKGGQQGIPMPIFRVVEAVTATGTTIKVRQGAGLPVFLKGIKVHPVGDSTKVITLGNVTFENDGYVATATITADSLGVLAAGDYLVLEDAADYEPTGVAFNNRVYKGVDLATAVVDCLVADGGRIDERLTAGIPLSIQRSYLQTLKLG